jgi:IS1 family transposase
VTAHAYLSHESTECSKADFCGGRTSGRQQHPRHVAHDQLSKPAILKLLADLGPVCAEYHDRVVRNVTAQRVQVDEIWQFVGAKAKNVKDEQRAHGWGDTWTWVGMCADTKLIVSWFIGQRDWDAAYSLMLDLSARLANRVQLTTDGNRLYVDAVEGAFGRQIDYAMLKKIYGFDSDEKRYSPAKMVTTETEVIRGNPDPRHISTSYIERQNLTMRMSMRRFTRLTNGFSKKVENHAYAVALHFVHYNFARIHKTLRVTPAMAAGLSDHVWSIEEMIDLLIQRERVAA